MNTVYTLEKILCIDDDPVFGYLLDETHKETGNDADLVILTKTSEAFQYLEQNEFPDLIFLDLNIPIEDGYDFLDKYHNEKQFHVRYPKTYIVIVTSSVHSKDVEKASSYEKVVDFISKPLSNEKIKEIVGRLFY